MQGLDCNLDPDWFENLPLQPPNAFLLQAEENPNPMILPDQDLVFDAGSELNIDMDNDDGNEDEELALVGDEEEDFEG